MKNDLKTVDINFVKEIATRTLDNLQGRLNKTDNLAMASEMLQLLAQLAYKIDSKYIYEEHGDISFDQFIDKVPDELFKWVQDKIQFFKNEYNRIEQESKIELKRIMELVPFKERKELAKHIVQYKYPQILFAKLDNKDISNYIWKILEPEHEIPVLSSMLFQEAE